MNESHASTDLNQQQHLFTHSTCNDKLWFYKDASHRKLLLFRSSFHMSLACEVCDLGKEEDVHLSEGLTI